MESCAQGVSIAPPYRTPWSHPSDDAGDACPGGSAVETGAKPCVSRDGRRDLSCNDTPLCYLF